MNAIEQAKQALEELTSLVKQRYSEDDADVHHEVLKAEAALSALSAISAEPEWYTGVDSHGCRRFYHKEEVRPGVGFDETLYASPLPQAAQPICDDCLQRKVCTKEGCRKPVSEQNARFAIDGAITYGRQGINKPPTDDHWLMPFWQIGRQLAAQPEQAAPWVPEGWRERLQEMRDASYTYSQYPELARVIFDSVIDALDELEAASPSVATVRDEALEDVLHAIKCTQVIAGREWHAGTALALQEELIATISSMQSQPASAGKDAEEKEKT